MCAAAFSREGPADLDAGNDDGSHSLVKKLGSGINGSLKALFVGLLVGDRIWDWLSCKGGMRNMGQVAADTDVHRLALPHG